MANGGLQVVSGALRRFRAAHKMRPSRLGGWALRRAGVCLALALSAVVAWPQALHALLDLTHVSKTVTGFVFDNPDCQPAFPLPGAPGTNSSQVLYVDFFVGDQDYCEAVQPVTPPPSTTFTVPVWYVVPRFPLYAGAGGDRQEPRSYPLAAALFALATLAAIGGVLRWWHLNRAAASRPVAAVALESPLPSGRFVRMRVPDVAATDGPAPRWQPQLEWRLLPEQPPLPAHADVYGVAGRPPRWLVVGLSDGQRLWPASRADPILGSGLETIEIAEVAGVPELAAPRRLLARYALILFEADRLLPLIQRPPRHEPSRLWWTIASPPGSLVRLLVEVHVRSRARALADGCGRLLPLATARGDEQQTRALGETRQECRALFDAVSRSGGVRTALRLIPSAMVPGVAVYAAFFDTPHLHAKSIVAVLALSVFLITIVGMVIAGIVVFARAVQCERTLLKLGAGRPETASAYELEQAAFGVVGLAPPREWKRSSVVVVSYLAFAAVVLATGVDLLARVIVVALAAVPAVWLAIRMWA